jgi:hypothetical protein
VCWPISIQINYFANKTFWRLNFRFFGQFLGEQKLAMSGAFFKIKKKQFAPNLGQFFFNLEHKKYLIAPKIN